MASMSHIAKMQCYVYTNVWACMFLYIHWPNTAYQRGYGFVYACSITTLVHKVVELNYKE